MVLPLHGFLTLMYWPVLPLAYHCSAQSCPTCFHPILRQSGSCASDHCLQTKTNQAIWQTAFIHGPTLKQEKFSKKFWWRHRVLRSPHDYAVWLCSTVWNWHLTWHLFSLGAAGEPERTDSHPDAQTQWTRLWPSATSQLQVYHPSLWQTRSSNWWHWLGQTAQYKMLHTADMHTWAGTTDTTWCWLNHSCTAASGVHSQIVSQAEYCHIFTRTTPLCAAMEANNLKELPVNTWASTKRNNFLI